MSQHSPSREAFLNLEHAKLTGNLPDVAIVRNNSHRTAWELREASTLNIEASHPLIKSWSIAWEGTPLNSPLFLPTFSEKIMPQDTRLPFQIEADKQLRKSTAKLIMPCTPVYRFDTTNQLEGFLNFTNSPNKAFDFSQDNYHYNQNFK